MARTRNPAFHAGLLAAATRVIARNGLAASTASIAKEAGVSTGTLFVYFESKTALINELYVGLKCEMVQVATETMPADTSPREQLRHMWDQWIAWSTAQPEKRRALAHLGVAEDLSDDSHAAVRGAYAEIAGHVSSIVASGPMGSAPLSFALSLMTAVTDATIDDLTAHPDPANVRSGVAFEALWRVLSG